jgi:UDP-N-acetylmuramoyl-L-alanyl-D-glutamate--2,6-diaminopimelate ligase
MNIDIKNIIPNIKKLKPIKGRGEFVDLGQNFKILIDYAHTKKATEEMFNFLNQFKKKRIITVIGCAGGREKEKRKILVF